MDKKALFGGIILGALSVFAGYFLCYKTYGFDLVDIDDSFGSCCGGFGEDTEESSDEE